MKAEEEARQKAEEERLQAEEEERQRRLVGKLWAGNVSWMSNKAIVFPRQNAPPAQRDDEKQKDNLDRGDNLL